MVARVLIPTVLQTLTSGQTQVEVDGATVAEVLLALDRAYPGIAERLLDENRALRRFVNIYVGEEDIRFHEGLDTTVPEGTDVSIIPAVAGG